MKIAQKGLEDQDLGQLHNDLGKANKSMGDEDSLLEEKSDGVWGRVVDDMVKRLEGELRRRLQVQRMDQPAMMVPTP